MKITNKGLGKGLDALINPDFYEENSRGADISSISINKIEPNKNQPRNKFDDEKILELSVSIKKQGVLQPILVRKTQQGQYQIIAGERRWRASISAGLKTIPAIVRDYNDAEALAVALIENLQREDLNVMEQATALERLKNELRVNQEELADYIGKSRSHLANTLRLINLPEQIKGQIRDNLITAGHARALLGLRNHESIIQVSRDIIKKNLSVRETENMIKSLNKPKNVGKRKEQNEAGLAEKMQELVKEKINKDIRVRFKGTSTKGQLVITYTNEKQLQDFMKILG